MKMKLTRNYAIIFFIAVVIFHLLIISNLIFFPYPELFIYPYLTNHGLIPYKDILDQHFPGLMFLPFNLDNLGMNNAFDARLWQLSVIALTQSLLFGIVYKITKKYSAALMASVIYLTWQPFLEGWVFWINSFLPLLYLPAFYLAYRFIDRGRKNFRDVFFVGLLLGFATVFKQVAIPLAGLTFILLFFYSKTLKTFVYFSAGYLPVVFSMLLYILGLGALADFWFWTVWFNLTTYEAEGGKGPTFTQLVRVLGIYSPVLLIPYNFSKQSALFLLIIVFLIGSLSGALHRFDFVHFQPSLPFIVITIVLLADKLIKLKFFQIVVIFYCLMTVVWLANFYRGHLGDYVYYFDEDTLKTAELVRTLTSPGTEIFVFGTSPIIYQMSETIPAGRVFVFQFPWFLKESDSRILDGLRSSQPEVIVADFSTQTQDYKITDFAPEIYKYILDNYHEEYQIGSNKILLKKASYAYKN